jgi:hypothetical protein
MFVSYQLLTVKDLSALDKLATEAFEPYTDYSDDEKEAQEFMDQDEVCLAVFNVDGITVNWYQANQGDVFFGPIMVDGKFVAGQSYAEIDRWATKDPKIKAVIKKIGAKINVERQKVFDRDEGFYWKDLFPLV